MLGIGSTYKIIHVALDGRFQRRNSDTHGTQ